MPSYPVDHLAVSLATFIPQTGSIDGFIQNLFALCDPHPRDLANDTRMNLTEEQSMGHH